jgi:hypothetical protein
LPDDSVPEESFRNCLLTSGEALYASGRYH